MHFFARFISSATQLAKAISCLLLATLTLASCLDNALPLYKDQSSEGGKSDVDPGEGSEISDDGNQLDQLLLDSFQQKGSADTETLIVEEIIAYRENPEQIAISPKEIRFLQESYYKALQQQPSEAPTSSTILDGVHTTFDFSTPEPCPERSFTAKVLKGGLRLVTYLPKRDSCTVEHSLKFEQAMNSVLLGRSIQLRYGAASQSASNIEQVRQFLSSQGFQLEAYYRVYFAPFFKVYAPTGDPYSPANEIPTPLWINADFKRKNGEAALMPAIHSEVMFHWTHTNEPDAFIKIYFSDRGFVFDDDDAQLPAWSGDRRLHTFSTSELSSLFAAIPDLHAAFETFRERAKVPLKLNGFGLLGVCNDGAALLVKAVLGDSLALPFPLVRTELISMPETFPAMSVWNSLPSDTFQSALNLSEEERKQSLGPRILNSNAFSGASPFPVFDALVEEIQRGDP